MSAVTTGDKFAAARDAMLAEIQRVQKSRSPGGAGQSHQAIRRRHPGHAQNHAGPGAGPRANWMAAGDLNFSERYLAAARRVTPASLQRVAREYLTPANRTLYALLPAGAAPKPAETVGVSAESAVRKIVFPNGLRLLVKEDHRLPFRRIARRFPRRRPGRNRVQQRPDAACVENAAPRHPQAQRRADRHRPSNPWAAASTVLAATTVSA